jgi:hypothetical protein
MGQASVEITPVFRTGGVEPVPCPQNHEKTHCENQRKIVPLSAAFLSDGGTLPDKGTA